MCTLRKPFGHETHGYELHFERPIHSSKNFGLKYNYRHLKKNGATLVALCA
jgi:hypothetical protein